MLPHEFLGGSPGSIGHPADLVRLLSWLDDPVTALSNTSRPQVHWKEPSNLLGKLTSEL